jgi:hypothetical protein
VSSAFLDSPKFQELQAKLFGYIAGHILFTGFKVIEKKLSAGNWKLHSPPTTHPK